MFKKLGEEFDKKASQTHELKEQVLMQIDDLHS